MRAVFLFIALMIQSWAMAWATIYELQLKNGNTLKTSHYWEEGSEIRFYLHGGVVGVQRSLVIGIKSSGESLQEYKEITPADNTMKDQRVEDRGRNPSDKEIEKSGSIDEHYYREQKATLKKKIEEALERNREATRRNDQEDKETTRLEMREYVKKIYDLEAELKEKNKGILPKWWNE